MNKNIFNKLRALLLFISQISFCLLICLACKTSAAEAVDSQMFTGKTMGTTYHIKVVMQNNKKTEVLNKLIEDKLKQVNQSMSVYSKSSEISLFNQSDQLTLFKISSAFYEVMLTAQKLYQITGGAWDGTVKPLVDLWGFGTKKEITSLPSAIIIRNYLENIGFDQIIIKDKSLQKQNSKITLDLGSIAKGFGVDAVARLLKENGYTNFLVEIGGEVVSSGQKISGKPWMVGISKPDKGENPNVVYLSLPLRDKALATSGDYRNFAIIDGKSYSHIIDPATGYPVDNGVVSASVISDTCTFADGLATALMVMGHEKGIKLVNSLDNTDCLIVVRGKDGNFTDYKSTNFPDQN